MFLILKTLLFAINAMKCTTDNVCFKKIAKSVIMTTDCLFQRRAITTPFKGIRNFFMQERVIKDCYLKNS